MTSNAHPGTRILGSLRSADGRGVVRMESRLDADGDLTIVAWEERGMPLDHLAAYGAGIQVHVEDLAAHLAGHERCDAEARFGELLPAYQGLASSIGLP